MLKWIFLVSVAVCTGLPAQEIKSSGEKISHAILQEVNKGVKLLDKIHDIMKEGKVKAVHPDFQRMAQSEIDKLLETDEGIGGVFSLFYGTEEGLMNGLQILADKSQLIIGHAPSDPKLECPDKLNRKLCVTPPGVAAGYVEVYDVGENPATWELTRLSHNTTYDPRQHDWYTNSPAHVWGSSFVYKHDEHSSGIAVTVSRAVIINGKQVGTAAVDIDLSGLDMVIGPLRPAPGSEAVLADPTTGKVIASTLPAARMVRFTHQQVSCFTPPFTQIFSPLAHTLGGLHRTARIGPVLLRADQVMGNLLRWDAIYSHPIALQKDRTWLLVVTDDSEHRTDAASSLHYNFLLFALLLLCTLA